MTEMLLTHLKTPLLVIRLQAYIYQICNSMDDASLLHPSIKRCPAAGVNTHLLTKGLPALCQQDAGNAIPHYANRMQAISYIS